MLHIDQIKIPLEQLLKDVPEELLKKGTIGAEEEGLVKKKTLKKLRIAPGQLKEFQIVKKSLDARKKNQIQYIYQVDCSCRAEKKILAKCGKGDVTYRKEEAGKRGAGTERQQTDPTGQTIAERRQTEPAGQAIAKRRQTEPAGQAMAERRQTEPTDQAMAERQTLFGKVSIGKKSPDNRPVVVGFGPAGMFAALQLARDGRTPLVAERGMDVDTRKRTVDLFWETNVLDPQSNVQFGEGGAGAFSDGKLNTLVKDVSGRNRRVLETLVEFGAPSEILYLQKPHIGTDRLREVVREIRREIISLGGEVLFGTQLVGWDAADGELREIELQGENGRMRTPCSCMVLALGHSARDTLLMIKEKGVWMEPKAFAVGVRIEHPQEMIGRSCYGAFYQKLPPADYKLTYQTQAGRGVYTFCMCPGGYVVNASSEPEMLAVNGMSYHSRAGENANSAIVVTVDQRDFGEDGILAGMEYQRSLERAAYQAAGGKVPIQLFGDFKEGKKSTSFGGFLPQIKGGYSFGNLRDVLPGEITAALIEGIEAFGQKRKGFNRQDAILSGVESRTSSPVRIRRGGNLQSNIRGIYPCGEGAGYAGGITSAAMDGLRVAEEIRKEYQTNG